MNFQPGYRGRKNCMNPENRTHLPPEKVIFEAMH